MTIWSGSTDTSASTSVYSSATIIPYFTIVNTSGSTLTLNIYIVQGSTLTRVAEKDISLAVGEIYKFSDSNGLYIPKDYYLSFTVDQTVDYYGYIKDVNE